MTLTRTQRSVQKQLQPYRELLIRADGMLSYIVYRDGLREPHQGFDLTRQEVEALIGELRAVTGDAK